MKAASGIRLVNVRNGWKLHFYKNGEKIGEYRIDDKSGDLKREFAETVIKAMKKYAAKTGVYANHVYSRILHGYFIAEYPWYFVYTDGDWAEMLFEIFRTPFQSKKVRLEDETTIRRVKETGCSFTVLAKEIPRLYNAIQ